MRGNSGLLGRPLALLAPGRDCSTPVSEPRSQEWQGEQRDHTSAPLRIGRARAGCVQEKGPGLPQPTATGRPSGSRAAGSGRLVRVFCLVRSPRSEGRRPPCATFPFWYDCHLTPRLPR